MAKLNSNDLIKYFEQIKNFDNGKILILDTFSTLLRSLKYDNVKLDDNVLEFIKNIILEENVFIKVYKGGLLDIYSFNEIIQFLLEKFNKEITSSIAQQIIEFQESLSIFSSGDRYVANMSNIILDIDFNNCWHFYAKLLKEKKVFQFWNIFDINVVSSVTFNNSFFNNSERNDLLFAWLLHNKEMAPWIIRVAPLFDDEGDNWFYFTESLINAFGDNEHFINELSANLHSMTTWGSRVPYLKSRLKLVEQLKNHKIEKVRIWANEEIENYLKSIKIEEINDEEEYLGY